MPAKNPPSQPTVEMTKDNLDTPEAASTLAVLAVLGLKKYGKATFVMRPDGGVAFANPAYVDIHPQAIEDLGDAPLRFIRPLLGDGKPLFVAWKDGVLWEVEVKNA